MNKVKKYILVIAIIVTCLFSMSFLAFNKYLNNKKEIIEEENQATLAKEKEKPLDNSIKITLYKDDAKEQQSTLKELKNSLGLSDDLNEKELSEVLSKKGYELDGVYDNEIIYKRLAEDSIEPDMYYIGECDGWIAIYVSDKDGKLTISNPQQDIMNEGKKFKDLPKNDQEIIKNRDLKFKTRDEAEEKISELIS